MTFTIFPGLVKPHCSFHSVVQELEVFLTLMYLDFQVIFFLPIYIRNELNKMKLGGAAKDKCDELNVTSNPSLIYAQPQSTEHMPVSDN